MTQALSRQGLQRTSQPVVTLQLTAMQLPQANPIAQDTRWETDSGNDRRPCQVRLSPEEPSELIVQISNLSDLTFDAILAVTGDFPLAWLPLPPSLQPPEQAATHEHEQTATLLRFRLESGSNDIVVCFTLNSDFFEERLALIDGHTYTLDYRGQVNVYASSTTQTQQLLASEDFTLHVRPHSRYPQYLPPVYQEVDFMHRFLAIFEQAFDPAVQTLSLMWAYLDPLTAPEAMLPFLAKWVGWHDIIPQSLAEQRRIIRCALSIYRWRGTRWGLMLYLHLHTRLPLCKTDVPDSDMHLIDAWEPEDQPESLRHIRVDDDAIDGFVVGRTDIGREAMLGGGRSYHFTVRLRSPARLDERSIRRIIDQEKPAFCNYDLYLDYYDRIALHV